LTAIIIGSHRRSAGSFALRQLCIGGAETALVGSRDDDAYPVPRLLYESIGFREAWRHLSFSASG